MRVVLALALLLLSVPAAYAAEGPGTPSVEAVPAIEATVVAEEVAEPEMQLQTIEIQQLQHTESAADAAQWPERGSFWWIVGAIVIGGIILAVILD